MDALLPELIAYVTIFLSDASLFTFFCAGGWALINKDVFRKLRLRTGRLRPARVLESAITDEDNFELWHYLLENHFKFLQGDDIYPILKIAVQADACRFVDAFMAFYDSGESDYLSISWKDKNEFFITETSATMLSVFSRHWPQYSYSHGVILLRAIAQRRWDFLRAMGPNWLNVAHEQVTNKNLAAIYGALVYLTHPPIALPEVEIIELGDLDVLVFLIEDLLLEPTPHIISRLTPSYLGYLVPRLVQLAFRYSDSNRLQEAINLIGAHESTALLFAPKFDDLLPFFNRIDQVPLMEEYCRKMFPKRFIDQNFFRLRRYHHISPVAVAFLQTLNPTNWRVLFNDLPEYFNGTFNALTMDKVQNLADLLVELEYDPPNAGDISYFILSITGRWKRFSTFFLWEHFWRIPQLMEHSAGFIHLLLQRGLISKQEVLNEAYTDYGLYPILWQAGMEPPLIVRNQ